MSASEFDDDFDAPATLDDVVSTLSSVESALSELSDAKSELDHLKDIADRLEEIATRVMAIELAPQDDWFDLLVPAGVVLVITAIAVWGWHMLG